MGVPASGDAVLDTSILINLAHTGRFDLLGALAPRFLFLGEVDTEILEPAQQALFTAAVANGWIVETELPALRGGRLYAEFSQRLGSGESACLAFACVHRVPIGCDEKGAFRRIARAQTPAPAVFGTPDIYVAAIRAGLLSVADADADKVLLAQRRFAMKFGSYADLLQSMPAGRSSGSSSSATPRPRASR